MFLNKLIAPEDGVSAETSAIYNKFVIKNVCLIDEFTRNFSKIIYECSGKERKNLYIMINYTIRDNTGNVSVMTLVNSFCI